MKKIMSLVGIIILALVLLLSGCTENDSGSTEPKTVTMTAKEVNDDMTMDSDWSTYVKILYTTLEDGDTLIIHDTIDDINYDPEMDRTTVSFNTSEGTYISLDLPFEGNITDLYQVGDEVKITTKIKYVEGTYEQGGASMAYELEIFEETWTNIDDYLASQGNALPSTCIAKV